MKLRKSLPAALAVLLTLGCAQIQELLQNGPLSEQEIVSGLKEALEFGTNYAVDEASQTNGFYGNPQLFIPFPEEVNVVERRLRSIGLNSLVDDFITRLNRAAEDAASQAGPIFLNSIRQMTIRDGLDILQGEPNAATNYLRRTTYDELYDLFQPVIQESLDRTAATRYWRDVIQAYNQIPFVDQVNPDLADYTNRRALDGLFLLIEEEEAAIRQNPEKRVTDLLRRVFGSREAQQS